MSWLQAALAVVLITGAILGWMIWHRRMRGDDTPLIGATKRRARDRDTDNELEAFITAYRGGKLDPVALTDGEDASLEPATTGATRSTGSAGAPSTTPPSTTPSPLPRRSNRTGTACSGQGNAAAPGGQACLPHVT